MNILHYLNVLIGFSLVMLLLSIVTSFAAQTWLVFFKTKARAVGNGLTSMLEDIGLEKNFAKLNVNALLDKGNSILGERVEGVLSKISAYFLAGAPKNIGREEFLLLLLRKARSESELAKNLGFKDEVEASEKLEALEKEMLVEETNNPALPAQAWRTNAMQKIVPELASKIFARFDEVIDRVTEDVSAFGKLLGIIITLPLLLINWPVDSMDLFNRLNNDQVLSEKLAGIAEVNLPTLEAAQKQLLECREKNSNDSQNCEDKSQAVNKLANNMVADLSSVVGLFGKNLDETNSYSCGDLYEGCKIAKMTRGMLVTWILVSLGSAFWLGVLNKMLGIRSEFSKKLDAQREFRATSQE